MPRKHCFVSASSVAGVQRWMWRAETADGLALRSSAREFESFEQCAKDAFAHGYAHIEVPVLNAISATRLPEPAIVVDRALDTDPGVHETEASLETVPGLPAATPLATSAMSVASSV